ncbi:type II secretion system F family protein, partial [Candidatus Uhrbacteria bacterium]|nr:type II secretion system F family protein [Candidatus Uhrbacteria bacterium]
HLRVMLRAGISLSRCLESLGSHAEQRRVGEILGVLRASVERGESFAERLTTYPGLFPPVVVELIRAGEATGTLEPALTEAAAHLRKTHELRSRVRGALMYPSIVLSAMVVLGVGVVVFILPRLLDIFRGVTVPLPLPTRVLLALSDAIARHGIVVGAAVVAIIAALIAAARSDPGRALSHRIILHLGRLGRIAREVNVARIARTLSGLLRTDIPIVRSLELTAATLTNVHYRAAITDAAAVVARGGTLRDALEHHRGLFPPTVIQMVAVGEEAAALDRLLTDVANFYEEDIDLSLRNLTTIIEPLLMLVIGAAVGFLAVAVLQPMYTVAQAI